jgi:hypothetical protein
MSFYFKHVPHIEDILLIDGNDCNGNCLAILMNHAFARRSFHFETLYVKTFIATVAVSCGAV